jgi:uncharacterized protein (UPF0332 family)
LKRLVNESDEINHLIDDAIKTKMLLEQEIIIEEINGHIQKSEHNLRFVNENIKLGFLDWSITGCYYACYHSALSLILTRGYFSKSHLITLALLIRDFYGKDFPVDEGKAIIERWVKFIVKIKAK